MRGAAWSERRIALLKELWAEGKTAAFIAAQLRISRSAVLGKVFRLRLGKAAKAKRFRSRAEATAAKRHPRSAGRRPALPVTAAAPERPRGKTLVELTNDSCRWPVGEPGRRGFHFCGASGADLENGRPYCAQHAKRAYLKRGKSAGPVPGMAGLRDLLAMPSPSIAPATRRGQRIVVTIPKRRG